MEWLTYLLKVSACTAIFFAFYLMVLKKLTFFKINRFFLLISLLLSFAIPALQFNIERLVESKPIVFEHVPLRIAQQPTVGQDQVMDQMVQMPSTESFNWQDLVKPVYLLVVIVLLIMCSRHLFRLLQHTKRYSKTFNGLKLVSKKTGFTNCSFFNYVFVNNESLTEAELKILLRHEEVHARQYHSIDKILLMIFKTVLWFNPIVYLYDKALEQTHEYEADEMTSLSFGNQTYATLMLKLAMSDNQAPLIHNFVKSPVKERIKMLFSSKSKNMKKLMYLLVLPLGLSLFWMFSVQIVYAQVEAPVKVASDAHLIGKAISGKITGSAKVLHAYTFDLFSGSKIYTIEATGFKDKIKTDDKVVAYIDGIMESFKKFDKKGKVVASSNTPIYILSKLTTENGKLIYERKIEKHAFLYEVNKARAASSKIKSIQRSASGTIEKIVLYDGIFTINLNLIAQNLREDNFKAGDKVLVKFIGEKQLSKNTYTTDKMIVLYSEPKKYVIKNESLYNRFYNSNGKQKIASVKVENPKTAQIIKANKPQILSFTTLDGDNKKGIIHMKNAVIQTFKGLLEATYVELNNKNNTMIATDARLTDGLGKVFSSPRMTFDFNSEKFGFTIEPKKLKEADENPSMDLKNVKQALGYNPESKVEYQAMDSIKLSKDKSIIFLYGNARLTYNELDLMADQITYNKKTQKVTARNLISYDKSGKIHLKQPYFEIDLNSKTGTNK